MNLQIKIQQFFHKFFTTKIDSQYSDRINLFKCSLLYIKKSKAIWFIYLTPLILSIIGIAINNDQKSRQAIIFWILSILISSICLPLYLSATTTFQLNSTSFYKKILIFTGIKRSYNLMPWIIVFLINFSNILLQVGYQNLFWYIRFHQWLNIDYYGFFYGAFLAINLSILIGLTLAICIRRQITLYLVSIFLPWLIIVLSNVVLYAISDFYANFSFINPFKYVFYLISESWTNTKHINSIMQSLQVQPLNLIRSNIFDLNTPWMIYSLKSSAALNISELGNVNNLSGFDFNQIINNIQDQNRIDFFMEIFKQSEIPGNAKILSDLNLTVMANAPIKIANLVMPWIFNIGFLTALLILDPLKRGRYE
ncbi:hypothetical protein MCAV_05610 [[Mycoplasma] cavipharyngis]|uniref:hypothetical protein n=1 Tax=[Mycoplasma] cavipharyngis TaxID=92757 RepID=UPI0037049C8C